MGALRILIAGQRLANAFGLRGALDHLGHDVLAVVRTPMEAVRMAVVLEPDLVFMEITASGRVVELEALDQIRSGGVPVVLISAEPDLSPTDTNQTNILQAHLDQPFGTRELQIAIESAMHSGSGQEVQHRGAEPLVTSRRELEEQIRKRTAALTLENEERLRIENALRESEARYRELLENMPDVWYSLDDQGRMTAVNTSAADFYGYDPTEIIGRGFSDFIHPDDRDMVATSFIDAIATHREYTRGLRFRVVAKSGRFHWVELNSHMRFDENGNYFREEGTLRDITETVELEQRLRTSEEQYRLLVENADLIVVRWTPDGRITYINRFGESFFGFSRDELIGRSIVGSIVPDRESSGRDLNEVFADVPQRPIAYRTHLNENINRRGDRFWISWTNKAVTDEEGRLLEILSFGRDCTAQQEAEKLVAWAQTELTERVEQNTRSLMEANEALRRKIDRRIALEAELLESKELHRQTVENSPNPIFTLDRNGVILSWNRACERVFGYGQNIVGVGHERLWASITDSTVVQNMIDRIFNGEIFGEQELSYSCHDGSIRHTVSRLYPLLSAHGDVQACVISSTDITQRRHMEEALRESRTWYKSLFDGALDTVFTIDLKGRFIDANPAAFEMTGYSREDMGNLDFRQLIHPDDACRATEDFEMLRTTAGQTPILEYRLKCKDGSFVTAEIRTQLIRRPGREDVIMGIARDVTQHRKAEEALRRSEANYRDIAEQIPGVVLQVLWRPDGTFSFPYVSGRVRELVGITPEELYENPEKAIEALHPQEREEIEKIVQVGTADLSQYQADLRVIRLDGAVRWIRIESSSQPLSDGEVLWNGIVFDVTERMEAERRLKVALLEKDVLLKEVHHRVKNNMQVISSLLNLQAGQEQDERVLEALREAQDRVAAMALVHENLYRSQSLAEIDLRTYLDGLLNTAARSYSGSGRQVTLNVSVEPGLILHLEQAVPCGLVLNEIISNTFKHAFPDGRSGHIQVNARQLENRKVEIRVSDSGIGLPEGFDPETDGYLGMMLIHSLVKMQLKGDLRIETDNGCSITFTLHDSAA
jgi:PAS domain S-box-containing protein